ncbi:MAG: MFS transporter [Pseudomonadota bacterium]
MTTETESAPLGFIGPLAGTFAVQTLVSMAMFGVAVIAPVAAPAIGVKAELIGTFSAIAYGVGMLAGLTTGAFAARFGAIRICQLTMIFVLLGVLALTISTPLAAVASAIMLGLSYGPVNPASTEILARVTTPRSRPFIFSVKQTGMPAGAALAGAVLPVLILVFDWRVAISAIGIAAIAVAFAIQPLRRKMDPAHDVPVGNGSSSILEPLRLVWQNPSLRCLGCIGFVYGGTQVAIATFYVIHLTTVLGFSLEVAGLLYTGLQVGAIAGRLIWGGVAGRFVPGNRVLVGLGLATPVFAFVAASYQTSWPLWSIAVFSVLIGMTSHGFNGVLFSELTKNTSQDKIGAVAGGLQFTMFAGVATMPLIFGLIVTFTQTYFLAYGTFALAVMLTAAYAAVGLVSPIGDTEEVAG